MSAMTPLPDTTGTQSADDRPTTGLSSWLRVLRDQRKTTLVAIALAVAALWILIPMGKPELGGCLAGGVILGLINHVATERWLLQVLAAGQELTRNRMIVATLVRLAVLSVAAIGAAVFFWPDGIGVLLGLAIFRLVALVMTSLPLLKELRSA